MKTRPSTQTILALLGLTSAAALSVGIIWQFLVQPALLSEYISKPLLSLWHIQKSVPDIQTRMIFGFIALGLLNGAGWWLIRKVPKAWGWILLVLGGLGSAAALLWMYPYGASDIFDYIVRGRISGVYSGNPFINLPAEYPNDPFYNYMWWHDAPTAYGPLWELLAGLSARLAGDGIIANVIAFKCLSGVFWIGSTAVVARILHRSNPSQVLPRTLLFAWNPILLYETFGNGHNDIVMVFFILLACWAFLENKLLPGFLALTGGVLVKFVPGLLLPAALAFSWRSLTGIRSRVRFTLLAGMACAALVAATYAPFFSGFQNFYLAHQQTLFTTSLPAVTYQLLKGWLGGYASPYVSLGAWILTAIWVFWQAFRLWRQPEIGFPQAAFHSLYFFLLVTITWFQPWYTPWVLALAVLLPSPWLWMAEVLVFFTRSKPLIFVPITYWESPYPPQPWLEIQLTLGVMGIPWLFTLAALLRDRVYLHKAAQAPPPGTEKIGF